MTLNDWDDEPASAKKFSSYEQAETFENTFDDWEITGSGKYDLTKIQDYMEDEEEHEAVDNKEELGQIVDTYERFLTTGKIEMQEEI